ncbi:XkdF-like putative serine protease domain-containing protein [Halalkalibacterium halodurans]|uniref:Phage-like element PBSX protein XkdF domain-containing protein n=1 Tax=Halalkalibacterium halodurans TaxID=86665 RepID=A0A0M0KMR0_ALKHA|nr:XkdF-like putative serine protease domain-containing protein [Halalkalibacterium halodurans]
MPRELINAQITHVSLVDKGANGKKFAIVKSEKDPVFQKTVSILKSDEEKQLVTGVVYEPEVEDAHGDFMTAEEIEKAAHQFLKDYRNIDKQHDFISDVGEVVESWIAKSDMTLGDEEITEGTWVMTVKVTDNESWESIKKGDITGFSMAGLAETIEKQKEAPVEDKSSMEAFFNLMKSFFTTGKSQVAKGEVRDNYQHNQARRNLWAVWDAMEDAFYSSIWHNPTPQVADFERIKAAANEFVEIVSEIQSPEAVEKAMAAKPEDVKKAKEDNEVKPEEFQQALEKAMDPLNKKLEVLEKSLETDSKESEGQAESSEENQLVEQVQKAIAPFVARIEKLEEVRGFTKQADDDGDGKEDVKKSDSLWDGIL